MPPFASETCTFREVEDEFELVVVVVPFEASRDNSREICEISREATELFDVNLVRGCLVLVEGHDREERICGVRGSINWSEEEVEAVEDEREGVLIVGVLESDPIEQDLGLCSSPDVSSFSTRADSAGTAVEEDDACGSGGRERSFGLSFAECSLECEGNKKRRESLVAL